MKRFIWMVLLLCPLLASCGASEEDSLCLGVDAVITQVDLDQRTVTVKDPGEEGVFGEACLVRCEDAPVLYCAYDTQEIRELSLEDLMVGDEILLGIRATELEALRSGGEAVVTARQIQLGTQRIQ